MKITSYSLCNIISKRSALPSFCTILEVRYNTSYIFKAICLRKPLRITLNSLLTRKIFRNFSCSFHLNFYSSIFTLCDFPFLLSRSRIIASLLIDKTFVLRFILQRFDKILTHCLSYTYSLFFSIP